MSLLPLFFWTDDPFVDQPGEPGLGLQARVEVALTTAPFAASPSWTDISEQVIAMDLNRDRRDGPGGPIDPATLRVTVENNDGRWNNASTYASAPYAGNVVPDRLVRWSVRYGEGEWRVQFLGYLDDVEESVTDYTGVVDLVASDVLRILEQTSLVDLVRPAELPGERVNAILSAASLPAGFISTVDNGTVTLRPETLSGSALALCQDVARAELGFFRAGVTGPVVFRDRYVWPRTTAYLTSQATFDGDDLEADPINYTSGSFHTTRAVSATGDSERLQRYTSTLLPANWPRTTDDAGDLPLLYDGDVEVWCEARQKWRESDPPNEARLGGVTLLAASHNGGGTPGVLQAIWDGYIDLLIAVSVLWRPAGWTADHDYNATIEGVSHRIDCVDGTWYTSLRLGPRFTAWESQVGNHFYRFGFSLTSDHRGSI